MDVFRIMAGSDVLVALFNAKGFAEFDRYGFFWCPVKLFEYMVSSKPVVSDDFPEVRGIVGDGGCLPNRGILRGLWRGW